MRDHDRRVSAAQLKNGEDVIRRRLRGLNFRLFMRISAGTAVFTKGNESRMGTGKGAFDYWAARVPVSRIIFEVKADVHEQVIRDAMRLAANKMPGNNIEIQIAEMNLIDAGLYEFVKKGDPPLMGITKLQGDVTAESLKRPRKPLAHPNVPSDYNTANRLPSTTPGMLPSNPSAASSAPSAP
jgi:ribosomal protein L16